MPSFLLKANPDEDFYVLWSTVTDAPHAWGSREVISRHPTGDWQTFAAERFERADRTGTSAMVGEPPWFSWEAGGILVVCNIGPTPGTLPRSALRAFCEALDRDEEAAARDFLTLIEDDDDDDDDDDE